MNSSISGRTLAGTTDTPTELSFSPKPTKSEVQFILDEIKDYLSEDITGIVYGVSWLSLPLRQNQPCLTNKNSIIQGKFNASHTYTQHAPSISKSKLWNKSKAHRGVGADRAVDTKSEFTQMQKYHSFQMWFDSETLCLCVWPWLILKYFLEASHELISGFF